MKSLLLACSMVCFAAVLAASTASAQTVKWVDQTGGSDANDGNTSGTAYATLQFAIDNSTSGLSTASPSIINVMNGAYQTPGQINAGGFATGIRVSGFDFLVIQAAPGHEPSARPNSGAAISVDASTFVVIDNLDLDGSLAGFDLMHVHTTDNLTIRNSELSSGLDGIDVETGGTAFLIEENRFTGLSEDAVDFSDGTYDDIVIQDNLFEADNRRPLLARDTGGTLQNFTVRRNYCRGTNSQEAFRFIGVQDVLFENNCIANCTQQALYLDSGCANVTVRHNTFYNSGEEELKTRVTGIDIVIKNNIFYANGASAAISIPSGNGPLPSEDYNLVYNDGASTEGGSFSQVTNWGANTITGLDPLFVNAGAGNLSLTAGSPAVEAGTDLGVTEDIDMNPRPDPNGTDPDMGAKELPGATPVENASWSHIKSRFGSKP